MCLPSSMSEATNSLISKFAVDDAYSPPCILRRLLMVSNVVDAPWSACGKKPRNWFVNTTSTKVLVAFRNRTACQFSKLVRLASTCPLQYKSRGLSGVVVAAVLCKITVSNNLRVADGALPDSPKVVICPAPSAVASGPEEEMG